MFIIIFDIMYSKKKKKKKIKCFENVFRVWTRIKLHVYD